MSGIKVTVESEVAPASEALQTGFVVGQAEDLVDESSTITNAAAVRQFWLDEDWSRMTQARDKDRQQASAIASKGVDTPGTTTSEMRRLLQQATCTRASHVPKKDFSVCESVD